jgi:hypothetical protein
MEIPDSFQQNYAFRFPASLTYFSRNVFSAVRASPVKGPVFELSRSGHGAQDFFHPYLFVFQEQHCK